MITYLNSYCTKAELTLNSLKLNLSQIIDILNSIFWLIQKSKHCINKKHFWCKIAVNYFLFITFKLIIFQTMIIQENARRIMQGNDYLKIFKNFF